MIPILFCPLSPDILYKICVLSVPSYNSLLVLLDLMKENVELHTYYRIWFLIFYLSILIGIENI